MRHEVCTVGKQTMNWMV